LGVYSLENNVWLPSNTHFSKRRLLVVFSNAVRADADFELLLKRLWLDAQVRGVSATFNAQ
jgi:hypothetical protein